MPTAAADLDVVIVNYRSRDLVLTCLESLPAGGQDLALTQTVVDNSSSDLLAALTERSDGTRWVDMGRNAGFAAANNRGMALGHGRHVLILNPDTVVTPGALRTLVEFADSHLRTGVVAPRLIYPDGRAQLTARAFPTAAAALFGRRSPLTRWFPRNPWSRRYLIEGERGPGDTEPFRVDWVSGAAMLVPRRVLNQVGGFDEDFFLFWEDADWCRRISDAGFEVWCVPTATVVHVEGGTRGARWSTSAIRNFHDGAYRYWRKHHAPQAWNPMRWAAALLLSMRALTLVCRSLLTRPTQAGTPFR